MSRFLHILMHETTTDTLCGSCGARNTSDTTTWCDNGMLHDGDTAGLEPVMSSKRKGARVVNALRHARCIAREALTLDELVVQSLADVAHADLEAAVDWANAELERREKRKTR